MALLGIEGFDWCTDSTKWVGSPWVCNLPGGVSITSPGRFGSGNYLNTATGDNARGFDFLLPAAAATVIAGCAYNAFGSGQVNQNIIQFADGVTDQLDVRMDGNGFLTVTRNGTLLATSTLRLLYNLWYYIELKATIDPAAGAYELRVNGQTILTASGVNTRASATSQVTAVRFRNGWYDDCYVADTTGSLNNDFLGEMRVYALRPSGAGNYTQWTPSVGANYAAVDETTPNDDTDYVSTAVAGNKDTYDYDTLPSSAATVRGVAQTIRHRKDDVGSHTIRTIARVSATDYPGSTVSVLDSYSNTVTLREVNPNTSAAWSVAEVNAAEFGHEFVA